MEKFLAIILLRRIWSDSAVASCPNVSFVVSAVRNSAPAHPQCLVGRSLSVTFHLVKLLKLSDFSSPCHLWIVQTRGLLFLFVCFLARKHLVGS